MLPTAILGGIGGGVGGSMFGAALILHSVWLGVIGLAAWVALLIWADWFLIPFKELDTHETRPSA